MNKFKAMLKYFWKYVHFVKTVSFLLVLVLAVISLLTILPLRIPIKPFIVLSGSMRPWILEGSVVFVRKTNDNFKVGEVITFIKPDNVRENVTHRIIAEEKIENKLIYRTKGDANKTEDLWRIRKESIWGKVLFAVPFLGYIVSFSKTKIGVILIIALPLIIIALDEVRIIYLEIKKMRKRKNLPPPLLVLALLFFLIFAPPVAAADLNIDCSSSCQKTGLDPFFNLDLDGLWRPGKIVTKILNLKNSATTPKILAIQGTRNGESSNLEEKIQISITAKPSGTVVWSGTAANFYMTDYVKMGMFAVGSSLDYNFTASLDTGADNSFQGRASVFDLKLGGWEETVLPTPTSSDGGGQVLGDGVSAPPCNDGAPGSSPVLGLASTTSNSVSLSWTSASAPVTYYLIAYGTTPNASQYGNPNVGGSEATNYTVGSLSGGTTYYFKVRAGNGCAPGVFSNIVSAVLSGGAVSGPAEGFREGVLGEAITSSPSLTILSPSPTGAVKGEENSNLGGQIGLLTAGVITLTVFVIGIKWLKK